MLVIFQKASVLNELPNDFYSHSVSKESTCRYEVYGPWYDE